MTYLIIKKLSYDLSFHAGLALIGQYLKSTKLKSLLDSAFLIRAGIANSDVLKSYIALLSLGKIDLNATENFRDNEFFKRALDLTHVPSSPTLRQRLDSFAAQWFDLIAQINHKLLSGRIGAKSIDFGAFDCGYTPVDLNIAAPAKQDRALCRSGGSREPGSHNVHQGRFAEDYCQSRTSMLAL